MFLDNRMVGVQPDSEQKDKTYYPVAALLANLFAFLMLLTNATRIESFGLIELHESFTSILYLNTLLFSIFKRGFFDYISIMLYLMFVFIISNVVFDLFGISSIRTSSIHLYYQIPSSTLHTIFFICDVFLATTAFCIFGLRSTKNDIITVRYNSRLESYTTLLVLILGPLAILYNLQNAVKFIGDSSAYTESYIEDSASSLLSISEILFRSVIPVYLASMPEGKFRRVAFSLIIGFIVCTAFGGSRTRALLPALLLIWYYTSRGNKISRGKILAGVLIGFVLMTLVVTMRGSAASWNIIKQISSDNVVFYMMANTIDYGYLIGDTHHNLYFLSNIINPILRYLVCPNAFTGGRNEMYANASFSLDHKIMYVINPEGFASGRGFGTSTLIEFYEFAGFVGVALLTLLYIYITKNIVFASLHSPLALIVAYWQLQSFFFCSRNSPLPSLLYLFISTFIYFAISFCCSHKHPEQSLASSRFRFESGGR